MNQAVYLQTRYQSAYSLLGAMAEQLADTLRALGHDVQEPDPSSPPAHGTFLFFNAPPTLATFPPALLERNSDLRAIQIFVDHPFALPADVLDQWNDRNGLENLSLYLPCADDAQLLGRRFPSLQHHWIPHAIPRHALCDSNDLTDQQWQGRPHDIVLAGSINTETEINTELSKLPQAAHAIVRETAAIMLRDPSLGYVQAIDLVHPTPRTWQMDQQQWRVTNMIVNRVRRTGVVNALQGLNAVVYGSDAWKPHCNGTIRHAGNAAYADIHRTFASARVAIAWGPTQFAHSYSERLMLAMAAGCAPISDNRHLVRRDFPNACALYNASNPTTARAACEHMLSNPERALKLAKNARKQAERECLWEHRVAKLLGHHAPQSQSV
ncbi:MAG: glycosyltransferase [Phycisphaerales bacterium]